MISVVPIEPPLLLQCSSSQSRSLRAYLPPYSILNPSPRKVPTGGRNSPPCCNISHQSWFGQAMRREICQVGPPLKPSKSIDGVAASMPLSLNLLLGSSNKSAQFVTDRRLLYSLIWWLAPVLCSLEWVIRNPPRLSLASPFYTRSLGFQRFSAF